MVVCLSYFRFDDLVRPNGTRASSDAHESPPTPFQSNEIHKTLQYFCLKHSLSIDEATSDARASDRALTYTMQCLLSIIEWFQILIIISLLIITIIFVEIVFFFRFHTVFAILRRVVPFSNFFSMPIRQQSTEESKSLGDARSRLNGSLWSRAVGSELNHREVEKAWHSLAAP